MKENKKKLTFYLSRHKVAIFFYIFLVAIGCGCNALMTILYAESLSHLTMFAFEIALRLLLVIGVLTVLRRVCWWISNYIYYKYSNVIWSEISLDLTKRSFELSSATFSENNTGSFMMRIMNDPEHVLNRLSGLVDNITGLLTSLVVIIYVITLNWLIGLLYVCVILGLSVLEYFRQEIRKKNRRKNRKINDKTYSLVTEIIKSEKDIKALNLEEKLFDTSTDSLNELKNSNYEFNMKDCHLWSIRNTVIEVFGVLILILGIHLMERNIITIATYILLFSYRNDLYHLVWGAGSLLQEFADISVSCNRMFSLYDETLYPADRFGKQILKNTKGKIEFKKVEYAYTEVKDNNQDEYTKKIKPVEHIKKEPVFKDLSFVIEPNTTVAFVGKSGSGKSTILSLIAKLMEADAGKVILDNKDIKTLTKETLRDNISLINQFPYIFDMTIKENLLLVKKDATDDEIWEVLKRACFDEDVRSMPNGLDTKVGETGIKLSGGQRQRLAIARALLKQSKIILFDESTSSLDNFAQSHIQKSIENMKGQHTIVIVAHRLSTIKNVDKIYFLHEGKIVDSGTFNELFENNQQFQDMFLIENI